MNVTVITLTQIFYNEWSVGVCGGVCLVGIPYKESIMYGFSHVSRVCVMWSFI